MHVNLDEVREEAHLGGERPLEGVSQTTGDPTPRGRVQAGVVGRPHNAGIKTADGPVLPRGKPSVEVEESQPRELADGRRKLSAQNVQLEEEVREMAEASPRIRELPRDQVVGEIDGVNAGEGARCRVE